MAEVIDDLPPPDFTRAPVFCRHLFAHPQRWLLAGECPPSLRDPTPWVRGVRAAVILGVLGWCAGLVGTVLMWVCRHVVGIQYEVVILGGTFGALVLLPLSRWSGWKRGAVAFIPLGVVTHLSFHLMNPERDSLIGIVCMVSIMTFTASLVDRRPRFPIVTIACTLAATAIALQGYEIFFQLPIAALVPSAMYQRWGELLMITSVEATFAIGFSGPFWRRVPLDVAMIQA